jgi:flagellar basal body-associated protein FliL
MASKPKNPEPAPEAAPADEPKKAGRLPPLKTILFAVIGLAVLGGGGFGGYKFLFAHGDTHDAPPAAKPSVFVDLPEVLVNLSNTGADRTQYPRSRSCLNCPTSN